MRRFWNFDCCPDGPMERGCVLMIELVGIGSGREEELQTVEVFAVEHVFEGVGVVWICTMLEKKFESGEIGMFGGVVEGFVVVGIGSCFEEELGKRRIIVEAGGGVETGKRIVGDFVGSGVGVSSELEQETRCFHQTVGVGRSRGRQNGRSRRRVAVRIFADRFFLLRGWVIR